MTNGLERYLSQPRGRHVWNYQRSIPADLQKYYGGKRLLVRSTKTDIKSKARKIRDQWEESDNMFWAALRRGADH